MYKSNCFTINIRHQNILIITVTLPVEVNRAIHLVIAEYNQEETAKAKKEKREAFLLPDISAHHLRHTFCTRLCENETNLKVIQSIMGHAVSSDARGKHIGEQFVKDCLQKGKELGFRVLQFNAVVESNVHARHLYERLGFKQLGTIPGGFRMKDGHYENICPYYREL